MNLPASLIFEQGVFLELLSAITGYFKEKGMTAHQIAHCWHLAIAAYDRKEFDIETLSDLVRGLKAQAKSMGILAETEASFEAQRPE